MEEAESVCPLVHHLVEPLLNPQLTNQQFINCAFLERPPSCVSLLSYRTALILLIGDSLIKETTKGVQRMSLRKGKKSRDDAGISTSNIMNKRRVKKGVSFDGDR